MTKVDPNIFRFKKNYDIGRSQSIFFWQYSLKNRWIRSEELYESIALK